MQLLLLKQDRSQQKENLAAREYGVCRPQPYRRGPSRQRAVAAVVEQGRTQQQLAREWGVARATVKRWVQGERARGEAALDPPRKQVRPPHPHWERASCPDQATDSRLPPTAVAAAACAVDPGSGR